MGVRPWTRRQRTRAVSFDYFVGDGEQRRRHREPEHPRSLVIDDEFEFRRLNNRKVRGLDALDDAIGIDADLP
jgi:hypothetical protein